MQVISLGLMRNMDFLGQHHHGTYLLNSPGRNLHSKGISALLSGLEKCFSMA